MDTSEDVRGINVYAVSEIKEDGLDSTDIDIVRASDGVNGALDTIVMDVLEHA
jgi:hypothetical protein